MNSKATPINRELAGQLAVVTGGRARPFVADVTDAVAVRKAFQEIERCLGSLAVNLRGAVLCSRA